MSSFPTLDVTMAKHEPGRFCTACGVFNLSHHCFCDNCGRPMPGTQAAAQATAEKVHFPDPRAPELPRQLRWLAPGAAVSCVLIVVLASVIWHTAKPPPTSQEVLEALRSDTERIAVPSTDLLCIKNLPYHRHQIQLSPDDAATRTWLESLVQAGLYAPGIEVFPDEMTGSTLMQFQALPALNNWRRNGSLCFAQGWEVEAVPAQSIHKNARTDRLQYVASLSWRAQGTAPWLHYLPPLSTRLAGVTVDSKGITTTTQQTFERVDGQWKIADE